MYRKVFLAYDAEGLADGAIPALIAVIGGTDAEVLLLSVRDDASALEDVGKLEGRIRDVKKRLQEAGIRVQSELRRVYRKSIGVEVLESAQAYRPDLVVMGSRGHGDLLGLLLHSVAHKVTAGLACPVMVVPGGDPVRPPALARILLALDGTRESMAALRAARALASEHHAEVKIVHAHETIAYGDGFGTAENDKMVGPMLRRAAGLVEHGVAKVSSEAVSGTPVAQAIADAAAEWNADLIVVGSRRHSSARARLLGSVAHGVVARTRRPVLVAERAELARVRAGQSAKTEYYPGIS